MHHAPMTVCLWMLVKTIFLQEIALKNEVIYPKSNLSFLRNKSFKICSRLKVYFSFLYIFFKVKESYRAKSTVQLYIRHVVYPRCKMKVNIKSFCLFNYNHFYKWWCKHFSFNKSKVLSILYYLSFKIIQVLI